MKNKKLDKKVFTDIFDGILSAGQKEIVEKFPELVKSIGNVINETPEDFNLEVFYPLDGIIRNSIAKKLNKPAYSKEVNSVVFIYTNYQYVEGHFNNIIKTKEGLACHADKSRWLINAIGRYYTTGKKIDMTIDDKCYWKPHFWTAEIWLEFFEAIKHLYFGNYNQYMMFFNKNWLPILKEMEKENNEKKMP